MARDIKGSPDRLAQGRTGDIARGRTDVDAAAREAAAYKPYHGIPAVPTGEGGPGSYQTAKGDSNG